MKKLMIAAVTTAMVGGAFAAPTCAPEETQPEVEDVALVYSFKATVKTTKGLAQKGYSITGNGTQCAPGDTTNVDCTVLRTKDSTKFEGWVYLCDNACALDTFSAVVWDSKRKVQLNDAAFTKTLLNVMGKKQTEAEYAWTFAGTADYGDDRAQAYALTGAGLGKFDVKNVRYSSFSGNFAGTAAASYDLKTKVAEAVLCACEPSKVWACDDLATLTDSETVAYGSWTLKYNSSASKKYLANGYLKVPSYVTIAN